ncbi:MAG TPA: TetR/AcrR family transcriptional regulator [Stackebrandtia sp.]|jgi:AcrR family transcriptional regulator|uniref:TetR/AcrR family transcriptional regulator n=1 Tax=Stackebrandtia sp. TaxID=2023065 RepID=UPI002D4A5FDE|nr:TetR/AcrR family transcriptional regulator [Stackebrandtia sp.]HZE39681.1 TetR/AcrR family transcriptional regulator [Stackebrandtia sp.]
MAKTRNTTKDKQVRLALLWGENESPSRGPKPSLSAARVAETARHLADAEGLDAVSMQRVADELGVSAMALYRYVPGKAELIDLMVDSFGTAPDLTDIEGGWRPRITAWARACWALYRAHPWVLGATAMRRQVMGPGQLSWLDAALAALADTGLTPVQRHDVFLLIIGHIRNLAQQMVEHDADDEAEWNQLTADVLARHGGRFPALMTAIAGGGFGPAHDDPLEFGLTVILDGVQDLIDRC